MLTNALPDMLQALRRKHHSGWHTSKVAAIVFLAAMAELSTQPAGGLPVLWPANAVLAGLLLRQPALERPVVWPMAGAVLLLAASAWNVPALLALVYGFANLASAFVCWRLLAQPDAAPNLRQPRAVAQVLAACIAAAATHTIAAGPFLLWLAADAPGSQASVIIHGFLGQLLGYCALLPPILTLPVPASRNRRRTPPRTQPRPETVPPFVCLLAGLTLCFLVGGPGILVFPIPPLLYCALAYRQHITAWLALLSVLTITLGATYGWIPFGDTPDPAGTAPWDMASLQLGALLLALAPLIMSCALAARSDTIAALNRALDHDTLTEALSRQAFLRGAQERLQDPALLRGTGLLMLDIDHFKRLNDTYGHAAGDQVLQAFAQTIRAAIRPQDLFGRIGGEEFGIVLPDTGPEEVAHIAERLRARVAEALTTCTESAEPIRITVSIGAVHDSRANGETLHSLLSYADQAMYRAKHGGRNRVCFHNARHRKHPHA
jgi:diguanylate cyclase (GGDEF)-like protein